MQRLSLGVIGAGGIARRRTIPALREAALCELVAVMDVVGAHEIAREFGVARAYTSDTALLADPAVHAVYVASPVHLHEHHVRAAAEAGKHVLCEKPLARTLAEAERMVATCRKHGVFLQEGYMMPFHGAHAAIRDLIGAGRIGRIVSMRAQLSCWYPPIPGAWRQDPALGGGGALLDMATHLYDLLEHFAGPVHAVSALTGNLVQDYAAEDAATTLLEFQCGAHATVDCFYCIPDAATRTRLEIYGSRGGILAEGTIGQGSGGTVEGILAVDAGGYDAAQGKDAAPVFAPIPYPPVNPYAAECDHFAACVLHGQPPTGHDGEHGLHIMRIAAAAYDAARHGRRVRVE